MKSSEKRVAQIHFDENRLEVIISSCTGVFLALHLLASFFPSSWMWGFHQWHFFPLPLRVLVVAGFILCVPGVASHVVEFLRLSIGPRVLKVPLRNTCWLACILSLCSFVVFYLLRSRTHFLGDGYMLLRTLTEGNTFMPSKPLDSFIHYLLCFLTRESLGWSAETVYVVISCLAGAFFVFVLTRFADSLGTDRLGKIAIFISVLLMGSMQFFFGYVESYSILLLELLVYVHVSVLYLKGKTGILLPSVITSIMICTHLSAVVFVPTLFFLFLAGSKPWKSWVPELRQFAGMLLGLVFPIALMMVIMKLSNVSMNMVKNELTGENHLLSLFGNPSDPDSFPYGILSVTHIANILNEIMLVAPVAIILIFPVTFVILLKKGRHDRISLFLAAVSLMGVIFILVLKPDLGASRDWDLFAASGLPWTLYMVYHFIHLPLSRERVLRLGLMLLVAVSLQTIPWIIINADADRSLDRFKLLVEKETSWSVTAKGTAFDELRSYYLERGMVDAYTEYASKAAEVQSNPRHYLNLGISLIEQGNYAEALSALEKVGDSSAYATNSHFNRGNAYLHLNELEKAIEEYQKSLQFDPRYAEAYSNLGIAYFRLERNEEARSAFQNALDIRPGYADAHYNLGLIHIMQGNAQEAATEFARTVESEPGHKGARFGLARLYSEQKRIGQAKTEYKNILEFAPNDIDAHFELGNLYLTEGDMEKAIGEFKRILEIQPEYADAHFKLGNVYMRIGNLREAASAFVKTIEINPRHFEAQSNLGIVYFHMGNEKAAIYQFQKAIDINPEHPDGHFNLGNMYIKGERYSEAIDSYQRVLQINPNHTDARCNMGIAYLQQGDVGAAISAFQQTLDVDPQHETARRMLNRARNPR